MSDIGAAATGKKAGAGKGAGKEGAKAEGSTATVQGQIGKMLVRAIWTQQWSAAHPEATMEQRKAAWREQRDAEMEKNLKLYRRAVNSLTRAGVTMTISEVAPKQGGKDDADDVGED